MKSPSVMRLAVAAAAAMVDMGQLAEVLPNRPLGSIGGWLERNNRSRRSKKRKVRAQLSQRLKPASGPGSINAESEMQDLVRAGKQEEAAAFYEACFRIHYKSGSPQMRWGNVWYRNYKRGLVA